MSLDEPNWITKLEGDPHELSFWHMYRKQTVKAFEEDYEPCFDALKIH